MSVSGRFGAWVLATVVVVAAGASGLRVGAGSVPPAIEPAAETTLAEESPSSSEATPPSTEPEASPPESTEPEHSVPASTDPEHSLPASTAPDESQPGSSEPDEPVPASTEPEQSPPVSPEPDEHTPADTVPDDTDGPVDTSTPSDEAPVAAAALAPPISVSVEQCLAADETIRHYTECSPAPGVTLTVFRGGIAVTTITTDSAGSAIVELPSGHTFTLGYVSGATSLWRPGQREEAQLRTGPATVFSLVQTAPPTVPMVVRAGEPRHASGGASPPAPGGCFSIVDESSGGTLLGPACDDDNDGRVMLGRLPPRPFGSYRAVVVSAPPGYVTSGLAFSFGVNPTVPGGDWIADLQFSAGMRIESFGTDDQPLPGMCFHVRLDEPSGVQSSTLCDDDADGVVETSGWMPHGRWVVSTVRTVPGYAAPASFTVTVDEAPEVVTVHPSSTSTGVPGTAAVLVSVIGQDGDPIVPFVACVQLFGESPPYNRSECTDILGAQVQFGDVPIGTYVVSPRSASNGCTQIGGNPTVTVTATDVGAIVPVELVIDCISSESPPEVICEVDEVIDRPVNLFYGQLIDPATGAVVATSLQLSRTIPIGLAAHLESVGAFDGTPIQADDLAAWEDGHGLFAWTASDWDGDARAALETEFGGAGGDVTYGAPRLQATVPTTLLGFTTFALAGETEGCEDFPPDEFAEIEQVRTATIRIYELDATVQFVDQPEPSEPPVVSPPSTAPTSTAPTSTSPTSAPPGTTTTSVVVTTTVAPPSASVPATPVPAAPSTTAVLGAGGTRVTLPATQ